MCEECEQEGLAAVYLRKANRHGWRPPLAAATAPRYDTIPAADGSAAPRQDGRFACTESARETRMD